MFPQLTRLLKLHFWLFYTYASWAFALGLHILLVFLFTPIIQFVSMISET